MSRGIGTQGTDSRERVRAAELMRSGNLDEAISIYKEQALRTEVPVPELCVQLARCYAQKGNSVEAFRWASSVVDGEEDYISWQGAAQLIPGELDTGLPGIRRKSKIAILGSSTTAHFVPLLRLAAARFGVALEMYEAPYGQYRQELLNPDSPTFRFDPDLILLAVDTNALMLPGFSTSPDEAVKQELSNWTALWDRAAEHTSAQILQFSFPAPPEDPLGHLSARLAGAKSSMIADLNQKLGRAAGNKVLLVDCERLSAMVGKNRWFDPRYWFLAKEAVAPEVLPVLAKHTGAVIVGALGMSRKCLVLDLDNTLWGGIVGEDGLEGIRLGQDAEGEAFVAFQEYLLSLKSKGVILAVCSKNNPRDAVRPFKEHPEMRLKLDDIAIFIANWEHKSANLRTIAQDLNIGLDSLVLVDDNPAEREAVRALVPEVDVILLPSDPAYYVRAVSRYLLLETSALTKEDVSKTEHYRARTQAVELRQSMDSLESFYEELRMKAAIAPFDEFHVPRIVQLLGKTNQFNLTTRRHREPEVRAFMEDPNVVTFYVRLQDRFTDHGLVALMIARREGSTLDIETWLMSCRVIGRTVESAMLNYLCRCAKELGCTKLRGTYIPTAKNELVKEIYLKYGFEALGETDGTTYWLYDLREQDDISNDFIEVVNNAGQ